MRISSPNNTFYLRPQNKNTQTPQSFGADRTSQPHKTYTDKIKTGLLAGMFLLPSAGMITSCSGDKKAADSNIITAPVDVSKQNKYLEQGERTFYIVKQGDTPAEIAEKFNISTRRLLHENALKKKDLIHPGDTLLVPESYKVKNVKTVGDVAKLTGFCNEFLNDLIDMEKVHYEIYNDRNVRETIGVGHYVKPSERSLYRDVKLDDKQVFTLLGQDLIDRDLDFKTIINEKAYNEIPASLKESVLDLIFNKGEGTVEYNKTLLNALNENDYVTAIANLTQDYSIVTNAKGEKVRKPASGLSRRRLYDIQHASKIFKNGMPDEVFKAAKKVYENGLVYMEAERKRGEISEQAYPHVKAEYQDYAYKWFDGKLGKKLVVPGEQKAENTAKDTTVKKTTATDNSKTISINGKSTKWTVNTLYDDWQRNANAKLRPFKRPIPEVDNSGNITATVKVLEPTGKGKWNKKVVIMNPGHGGAMGIGDNVNFDPGTSNAVMSKKNPNIETNVFTGNEGKALEEWFVNQKIADDLADKIRAAGGKVIYVQGSVHTAQKAIRKIQNQKNNKIDMIISLHSNSDGAKRGVYVIANKRKGVLDKKDAALTKTVTDKLNQDSWFKGITTNTAQSLAVLSMSASATSPVPGMLIETGNLKNKTDVANLNSKTFHNKLVDHIFNGAIEYLNKK